jgi:hypothetical protein
MESLLKGKPIFSWNFVATAGSSQNSLEKKALLKKLGMESGRKLLKKPNLMKSGFFVETYFISLANL